VLEFELVKAGEPSWNRPDVGIGEDDVKTSAREVAVTVHGLGAVASPAGEVVLEDAAGAPVATARFAGLVAPVDLRPKTTVVRLKLAAPTGPYRVRLVLDGGVREITQRNNSVMIAAPGR
jgi:hypothetical protein